MSATGRLYIGIRDDGTVIGLDNPNEVTSQISNMVMDAAKPDMTIFLCYEIAEDHGKQIAAIDI